MLKSNWGNTAWHKHLLKFFVFQFSGGLMVLDYLTTKQLQGQFGSFFFGASLMVCAVVLANTWRDFKIATQRKTLVPGFSPVNSFYNKDGWSSANDARFASRFSE